MKCSIPDFSQPYPQTGRLKQMTNLNLSRKALCDALCKIISGTPATVYSYIVATVKYPEGVFIQTGSAPNFQGDVISLCTCKHFMRSFRGIDSWRDTWIAGFTGIGAGKVRRNALIYLMKVRVAFESYSDLWYSEDVPDAVKQAKLASENKHGDIFQPKSKPADNRDKYDFKRYCPPISDHVHKDVWHKDINYEKGVCGRKAALLIGDEQYSYLWNQPQLFHSEQLNRGHRKYDLQSFLKCLYLKDK